MSIKLIPRINRDFKEEQRDDIKFLLEKNFMNECDPLKKEMSIDFTMPFVTPMCVWIQKLKNGMLSKKSRSCEFVTNFGWKVTTVLFLLLYLMQFLLLHSFLKKSQTMKKKKKVTNNLFKLITIFFIAELFFATLKSLFLCCEILIN